MGSKDSGVVILDELSVDARDELSRSTCTTGLAMIGIGGIGIELCANPSDSGLTIGGRTFSGLINRYGLPL